MKYAEGFYPHTDNQPMNYKLTINIQAEKS